MTSPHNQQGTAREQILGWLDANEDAFAWVDDTFHRRRFVSGLSELQSMLKESLRSQQEAEQPKEHP